MDTIITERLILRNFTDKDYDELYELLSQYENDEFEPHPGISYKSTEEHLKRRTESDNFLAVILKSSNKLIGNIYFAKREFMTREIGFLMHEDYKRQGYAYEAVKAVISHAFSTGVHRIYGECDPRNPASWKLMEKAGMKREAHLRKNMFFHIDKEGNPVWKDTYVYAVISDDF